MQQNYDVIIVGAGPAGSMAGYFLAKQGFSCLLLDKAKFPRDKPCGGGISGKCIKQYPFLREFAKFPSYRIIIGGEDVAKPGDVYCEKEPFSFTVRRAEFDHQLLLQAQNAGTKVLEDSRVTRVRESEDSVSIQIKDGIEFQAKFVLGADGVNSIVRKESGLERFWNKDRLAFVLVSILEVKPEVAKPYLTELNNSYAHIGFGHRLGYSWIFPSSTSFNIGYGALLPTDELKKLNSLFYQYVQACQKNGLIPEGPIPKPKLWPIPFDGGMKKCATRRIMLLGDAGGFCQALSGEGIQYAIQSADIAVKSIENYIRDPRKPIERVSKSYMKNLWKAFGKDLKSAANRIKMLDKFGVSPNEIIQADPKIGPLMQALMMGTKSYQKLKWKMLMRGAIAILRIKFGSKKK